MSSPSAWRASSPPRASPGGRPSPWSCPRDPPPTRRRRRRRDGPARRRLQQQAEGADRELADDHDARRGPQGASDAQGGAGSFNPSAIYKRESPGVVTIISTGLDSPNGGDAQSGLGSGFVISGNGEIATNAHVVTSG